MARVISFYSFKGGVGRSVLLANTAAILAKQGFKVVCVDLDLEAGGLHTIFGINPERGTFLDLLLPNPPIVNHVTYDLTPMLSQNHRKGQLMVLPSIAEPHAVEQMQVARFQLTPIFRRIVGNITDEYDPDFILVDTRSGFAELTYTSIKLADRIVIVLRANKQNTEGLRFFLDIIANTREPPETLLVLNQIPSGNAAKVRIHELEGMLGDDRKFEVLIPYDSRLALDEKVFPLTSTDPKDVKDSWKVIAAYKQVVEWLQK